MPTILFLFFLLKQQISLFQIMTPSNNRRVQCLSGPETDPGKRLRKTGRSFQSTSFFFFNVLLVLLLFKFRDKVLVWDKAAVSDHEARSKYRPRPRSRSCARTRASSNTASRLGLTRENRLCVNTDSDLDLRREGEEERWMEIWKKGVAERKREEWYRKRGWGDFCGWGNKRGNREAESDI